MEGGSGGEGGERGRFLEMVFGKKVYGTKSGFHGTALVLKMREKEREGKGKEEGVVMVLGSVYSIY